MTTPHYIYTSVFVCVQVFAEFHRITNMNPRNRFFCELDRHTPQLLQLYRQKTSQTGKTAEALREILKIYYLETNLGLILSWGQSVSYNVLPVLILILIKNGKFVIICNCLAMLLYTKWVCRKSISLMINIYLIFYQGTA